MTGMHLRMTRVSALLILIIKRGNRTMALRKKRFKVVLWLKSKKRM
jgi:hypothetical protein